MMCWKFDNFKFHSPHYWSLGFWGCLIDKEWKSFIYIYIYIYNGCVIYQGALMILQQLSSNIGGDLHICISSIKWEVKTRYWEMIVGVHIAHSSWWHCLEIKSWHAFMRIVKIKLYMYIFYTYDLISTTIKTCCCSYFSFKK